jgi:type II secretory pathway pseudopilin PulG
MSRSPSHRRNRAFSIFEMLVAILLLGAVGVLLPRIFTGTMRVVREAPAASNAIITNHAMLDQLRHDTWAASEIRAAADGQSLTIAIAGREIRWSVQPKQTENGPEIDVTRTAGDDRRSWNVSAVTMRFDPSPAGALVRFGPAGVGDDSVLLVSQLAQLRRGGGGTP